METCWVTWSQSHSINLTGLCEDKIEVRRRIEALWPPEASFNTCAWEGRGTATLEVVVALVAWSWWQRNIKLTNTTYSCIVYLRWDRFPVSQASSPSTEINLSCVFWGKDLQKESAWKWSSACSHDLGPYQLIRASLLSQAASHFFRQLVAAPKRKSCFKFGKKNDFPVHMLTSYLNMTDTWSECFQSRLVMGWSVYTYMAESINAPELLVECSTSETTDGKLHFFSDSTHVKIHFAGRQLAYQGVVFISVCFLYNPFLTQTIKVSFGHPNYWKTKKKIQDSGFRDTLWFQQGSN